MTRVVSDLNITIGRLLPMLRRADIPTPRAGYWSKKAAGKPVSQVPLPAVPKGSSDLLTINMEAEPETHGPKTEQLKAASKKQTKLADANAKSETSSAPVPAITARRPTQPTKLTREELYAAVWGTPMARLAERFGISGNGLAKVCDRENIPYPPRGHWAKQAAGKAIKVAPLPALKEGRPAIIIRPTPLPPPPAAIPEEISRDLEAAREKSASVTVPDRLVRPHPIIARWLAEHEEKKARARQERDPWRKQLYDPGQLSEGDRRRHRFLDSLFKAVERQGARAKQGERHELFIVCSGEDVQFHIREKQKQVRRPLRPDEQRWRGPDSKGWTQELVSTGRLVFEIKTYLPAGLKSQWLETDQLSLEEMLPEIVSTFIAAGPALVKRRQEREAAERERQLAEMRRYEEQQRRKRDASRWRHFQEIAKYSRDLDAARKFLGKLRALDANPSLEIDGLTVAQWLEWAEGWVKKADPLSNGVENVFERIAKIAEWSYRD